MAYDISLYVVFSWRNYFMNSIPLSGELKASKKLVFPFGFDTKSGNQISIDISHTSSKHCCIVGTNDSANTAMVKNLVYQGIKHHSPEELKFIILGPFASKYSTIEYNKNKGINPYFIDSFVAKNQSSQSIDDFSYLLSYIEGIKKYIETLRDLCEDKEVDDIHHHNIIYPNNMIPKIIIIMEVLEEPNIAIPIEIREVYNNFAIFMSRIARQFNISMCYVANSPSHLNSIISQVGKIIAMPFASDTDSNLYQSAFGSRLTDLTALIDGKAYFTDEESGLIEFVPAVITQDNSDDEEIWKLVG